MRAVWVAALAPHAGMVAGMVPVVVAVVVVVVVVVVVDQEPELEE